ncbi:hypothetical protein H0N98_04760 [Candidatus Micrarchaeota archaeon]|nr:hypothetical protein [Candidatus Micrarchaeota archaeon]
MESETGSGAVESVDPNFLKASSEARRLEREAMPTGNKVFPSGAIFEQFDVEKISIDSYEAALKSAEEIERRGVKTAKRVEKEEKSDKVLGPRISEKELERIPKEKVEVLTRSEQEIADEERKLTNMKEKFAKLMSEIPKEQPVQIAPKAEPVPEAPGERQPILGTPKNEPAKAMESMLGAVKAEEKPAVDAAKAEEIKELSENFKRITMKKEEREKQERIRKMKKEIEDMLESG